MRLKRTWMYLVAVIDWYLRYVLSWALDGTLEMALVLDAVDAALAQGTPEIWNSHQGSHFTSPLYTDRLKAAGVAISMDGKGRALDHIFTERLWRTIKYEEVYLHEYATPREARIGIGRYLRFYNDDRIRPPTIARRPRSTGLARLFQPAVVIVHRSTGCGVPRPRSPPAPSSHPHPLATAPATHSSRLKTSQGGDIADGPLRSLPSQ